MSRLMDPRRPDGTFPFEFTDRSRQDCRATWDKHCPGWRDRKPGNYDRVITSIKTKQFRAKS